MDRDNESYLNIDKEKFSFLYYVMNLSLFNFQLLFYPKLFFHREKGKLVFQSFDFSRKDSSE
jgi:hypothetical protein